MVGPPSRGLAMFRSDVERGFGHNNHHFSVKKLVHRLRAVR